MPMPGRTYNSGSYRYGFNGQEKSDEIAGVGNSYSAEFWQYDSRLGRRWETDIIIKPWISPYSVLSNNPLCRIDPHGDDDYFNSNGVFIGSDGRSSNTIRIVNSSYLATTNFFQKNGMVNSKVAEVMSTKFFDFASNEENAASNRIHVIYGVANHYGEAVGVSGEVGLGFRLNKSSVPAYTQGKNVKANVMYNANPETLNNAANVSSILNHEKLHQERPVISYYDHAKVYYNEIMDYNVFNKTDTKYKVSAIKQMIVRVMNSEIEDGSGVNAQNLINDFNSNNKYGLRISLSYQANDIEDRIYKISETKSRKSWEVKYEKVDTPSE